MIKKIVSYIGIAGILSIIILSIFDRLFFYKQKGICCMVGDIRYIASSYTYT